MEPLAIAAAIILSSTSSSTVSEELELAPGDAPRCTPACAIGAECLETSQGWRCISHDAEPPSEPTVRRTRSASYVQPEAEESSGSRIMLSAERLFGWGTQTTSIDAPAQFESPELSQSYVGFLRGAAISPFASPRIALDVVLPIGLTLGGAVSVVDTTLSERIPSGFGTNQNVDIEELGFLVVARAGYFIDVGSWFAMWLRLGLSLVDAESGGSSGLGLFGLAVSPEAMAIAKLNSFVALSAGVVFELPIAGSTHGTTGNVERDVKMSHSALTAGLILMF